MKFKKTTTFNKAYDKRNDDPKKNYGIGAVTCRMVLLGELGATQFSFSTGMYLPHVEAELEAKNSTGLKPMGYDVGYHSSKPQYEGQSERGCDLLPGKKCFYDGSSLRAEEWMKIFIEEGSEKIWGMLEENYQELFVSEESK